SHSLSLSPHTHTHTHTLIHSSSTCRGRPCARVLAPLMHAQVEYVTDPRVVDLLHQQGERGQGFLQAFGAAIRRTGGPDLSSGELYRDDEDLEEDAELALETELARLRARWDSGELTALPPGVPRELVTGGGAGFASLDDR